MAAGSASRSGSPARPTGPTSARWAAGLAATLVFLGSLIMWIGILPAWVWLLSRLGGTPATYALVLVGLPITLFLWGQLLGRLDRLYARLAGDALGDPDAPRTVLSASLTAAFVIAAVLAGVWVALHGLGSGHAFGPFPD